MGLSQRIVLLIVEGMERDWAGYVHLGILYTHTHIHTRTETAENEELFGFSLVWRRMDEDIMAHNSSASNAVGNSTLSYTTLTHVTFLLGTVGLAG